MFFCFFEKYELCCRKKSSELLIDFKKLQSLLQTVGVYWGLLGSISLVLICRFQILMMIFHLCVNLTSVDALERGMKYLFKMKHYISELRDHRSFEGVYLWRPCSKTGVVSEVLHFHSMLESVTPFFSFFTGWRDGNFSVSLFVWLTFSQNAHHRGPLLKTPNWWK